MPPRPKKPSAKDKSSNAFLEAINFLSCIQSETGAPYETHILLQNKTAIAYTDTLSAGIKIEEDLYCAPYTKSFKDALSKCGEGYSLVIDGQKIIVKSGKFKASIPCIDPTYFVTRVPDNPCAAIDDRFKEALKCMDLVKPELNAQKVYLLAFLLNGQSVISTDGRIIFEFWHGIDLPQNIGIPKAIITPILKNQKKLLSFGFSNSSVTFYFEDGSWIKSQLYNEQFPTDLIWQILNRASNPNQIPTDFYKALDAVTPFADKGVVTFERELLCTPSASHEVSGLPKGPIYSVKYLSMIKEYATKIDFVVPGEHGSFMCYFFGNAIRGVIAGHG